MRIRKIVRFLTAPIIAALLAVFCVSAPTQAAPAIPDKATKMWNAFIDKYWDPEAQYFYTYSDRHVHAGHHAGPRNGLYTDYWWEAQLWNTVMDRYERVGDDQSRQMIDQVFDGWRAFYPDFSRNEYNDDMGWWAQGAIRAWKLTGDDKYLTEAVSIFDFISQFEDDHFGGGIWWKNTNVGNPYRNEKNVATNGTAAWIAAELYMATADSTYKDIAQRLIAFLEEVFFNGGHLKDNIKEDGVVNSWDFTYNNGAFAAAATRLYQITNDEKYLNEARAAFDWAIDNLTIGGIFTGERGGDGQAFKAIFTRHLRDYINVTGDDSYENFLSVNARAAAQNTGLNSIGWTDWVFKAPLLITEARASVSAASAVSIVHQAQPGFTHVPFPEVGTIEIENGAHDGIDTEANGEYTGRGYLAGWNSVDTSATVAFQSKWGGLHRLNIRYAAGNGDAARAVLVNGFPAVSAQMPATDGWQDWQTVSIPVLLVPGTNTVELKFDRLVATNYANIDSITIEKG
ncbi:MAG: glycoside hydrolase family 76 protein [Actinomyces sp.]|nr:glycoside hydrolase family 76 protein [Actinomyces sp.]